MEPNTPPIDLQQAWQTAFQLRTCPDDATLRASTTDENLKRHLTACSICREKRAMPVEQLDAWQGLFNMFAPLVHQAVNTPQPGQVWVLKKKLSRWDDNGHYYSPPNVLLIEKLDDKHGYRAAQLYFDKRLMGEGDVWFGDRFGFAQGWNSYTIHKDALECWLGNAADRQVAEVIHSGTLKSAPVEEHSIISFFRKLEITVGSYVAVPSVVELVEELESAEETVIELIPGLKLAARGAKDFVLDIASGTLDLLRGTFKPAMLTRSAVAMLSDEQKRLIQDNCPVVPVDLKVVDDTLTVTLKWLQEKPAKVPEISMIVNNVNLPDVQIIDMRGDIISFRCKDENIFSDEMCCLYQIKIDGNTEHFIIKLDFHKG